MYVDGNMKALVIYESQHHGNTAKIAEAISEVLGARLVRVAAAPTSLEGYDLVGFGSGIFYGGHHRKLLDFVERLDGGQLRAAFIFSTSGSGKTNGHRALRRLLGRKGFDIVGDFACPGYDRFGLLRLIGGVYKGRPGDKDITNAKKFAEDLKRKLE